MTCNPTGTPVFLILENSDVTEGVEIPAFVDKHDGTGRVAKTLGAKEWIELHDCEISPAADMHYSVYDSSAGAAADDLKSRLFHQHTVNNGGRLGAVCIPRRCRDGALPVIKSDTDGQVSVILTGVLRQR